ncbi:MAG: hypothetical protein MUF49_10500 [Oculatellaceae cyanobacterium Prado106]|jgi:hypothetical protein|nr:hypothetical protein [Oculatellaceae cyanobacterium Prado106]
MPSKGNTAWNLESFLDSLIFELDKAQDTLSVKGLNRKLTYTVKDISLDLQIFPEFDGDTVKFTTAKPGEAGASKVSFQLGSIRDSQIREVTRRPMSRDEISIEEVNIPEPQRKELKRLGIQSTEDLRRTLEEKNVDLEKVTDKVKVDYKGLANLLNQTHRKQIPPNIAKVSVAKSEGDTILTLEGDNLAIATSLDQYPIAVLNNEAVEVLDANKNQLRLRIPSHHLQHSSSQLQIALDPYAIVRMKLQN